MQHVWREEAGIQKLHRKMLRRRDCLEDLGADGRILMKSNSLLLLGTRKQLKGVWQKSNVA
jgi:hypothetical protein